MPRDNVGDNVSGIEFFPDDPLRTYYGELMPELSPDWDALTEWEKAVWLHHGKRTLIALIKLFQPRYVTLTYYRPYQAEVMTHHQETGNVSLGVVNLTSFK